MKSKIKNFFKKRENLYLTLALVFGGFMVFFNPPFAGVPDEGAHYLRAANIVQGDILCSNDGRISKASHDLIDEIKPIKINGSNDEKISLGKIKKALLEKDSREVIQFSGAVCSSNPLGYIPQVVGIKLADISNLPVLWGFYLGRLLNMLVAVTITFYAIKFLPFGKIIFVLIALLPMTIQQYASISYDSLHISMIFLFTAYALKLSVEEKKISRKEMCILAIFSILAANIKWGFFPIMLLLFILPRKKFITKKKYWAFVLSIIFISSSLFLMAQIGSINSEGARDGVYPGDQLTFVAKNPIGFLNTVFYTIYDDANFFFETFLYKPGWLNDSMPPVLYVFIVIGMILIIKNEEEEVFLKKWQRITIGMTFFLSLLFVFLSLYVFWTKVGGLKVQGVQGRYFLGFSPLLVLAFYKSGFNLKFKWVRENLDKLVLIFAAVVFILTFISLWNIYYDKSENKGKYVYRQYVNKEGKDSAKTELVKKNIKQIILVEDNDFFGVKFFIKKGIYTGKGTFYLKDAECQNVLRKKEMSWEKEEFGSIEVKFGTVSGIKNKKFCFEGDVSFEQELPIKVSENSYGEGTMKVDDKELDNKDLIFDQVLKN